MALKGTLKDFGIGDILQLIGQQQKTGTLHLHAGEQEVHIGFRAGTIVKVESSTRKRRELIGTMLVRAGLISEPQLAAALDTQQRTLQRLGDVLVAKGHLAAERFQQMMQLQATETLYHLFDWKSGTYEFSPGEVELEPDAIQPLRPESVLMEGFRMVDEWPQVRRALGGPGTTFVQVRALAPPPVSKRDAFEGAFDDAFKASGDREERAPEGGASARLIGDAERRVFGLVQPDLDVSGLVERSCLGEFETCKALATLVRLGYLRAVQPQGQRPVAQGPWRPERLARLGGGLTVTVLLVALLGVVGTRLELASLGPARTPAFSYADPALQRLLWQAQRGRIEAALEVFRLERGELPEQLDALVEAGLLVPEDLRYPWQETAHYQRLAARQFVLLPPLR
jgi:hypothetical protein